MIRKIISIDEERCNGCGLCAGACHEGAIAMIDGKARLIRDDYCDGLGACLPSCPVDAISMIVREADAFDEEAVKAAQTEKEMAKTSQISPASAGCPGVRAQAIEHDEVTRPIQQASEVSFESRLGQWPVQIQLAPLNAPYYDGAGLLIAADCVAYAHANFHNRFMKNKVTLIGCPKLDPVHYADKLTEILKRNAIKSLTLVRMEVPCCGGLEHAVVQALQDSGKFIPWQVTTLSIRGDILEEN